MAHRLVKLYLIVMLLIKPSTCIPTTVLVTSTKASTEFDMDVYRFRPSSGELMLPAMGER